MADPPQAPDFSGAWRLDDQHSDSADAVIAMLNREAKREQAPTTNTQPAASSSSTTPPSSRGGGHGMGGGGMGGGMGGGGMGGGGMGGGGHGGRGHGGQNQSSPSNTAAPSYPLPPILKADSVLLVQQDSHTLQVRLDSGEQLNSRMDGQNQQSLNGDAMVSTRYDANSMQILIAYADGSTLMQLWTRSADGHQITVEEQWRPPMLKNAVSFKRTYVSLG